MPEADWDAVIVGSGFGGAVSALRLAQAGWRVLVLERGRPWPQGSFPRAPRRLPEMFWDPDGGRYGYLQVHRFRGMTAAVGAGLGGGSLVYANVLLRKPADTFVDVDGERWPVGAAGLEPHYRAVLEVLAPRPFPHGEPYDAVGRAGRMAEAAAALGLEAKRPPLAVAFAPTPDGSTPGPRQIVEEAVPTLHRLPRMTCRLCGECDIGCNDGAKSTLDHTYLSRALEHDARIWTLTEADTLRRVDGHWEVGFRRHLEQRDGIDSRLLDGGGQARGTVRARHVVLAAGAIATTALLARNAHRLPGLSPMLGRRMSANGDLLGFVVGARLPLDPSAGPVITTSVEVDGAPRGFYVQDGGHPALADALLQLADAPRHGAALARVLGADVVARLRGRRSTDLGAEIADVLGAGRLPATTMPLLAMGRDVAGGRLTVDRHGQTDIRWDGAAEAPYYEAVRATCRQLARTLGGRFWETPAGTVLSAHPLGGCAMSRSPQTGVVDELGRVHGLDDLHVHDGAAMPGPVGPNPSLTIAALADRASCAMTGSAP